MMGHFPNLTWFGFGIYRRRPSVLRLRMANVSDMKFSECYKAAMSPIPWG